MRRATITLPDDLEAEVQEYLDSQEAPPSLTTLVQAALRRYLEEMRLVRLEYQPARRPFEITPAEVGSGLYDVSVRHDHYIAEPDPGYPEPEPECAEPDPE